MKKLYICLCITALVVTCKGDDSRLDKQKQANIRPPVAAGQFYSADSTKLRSAFKSFFADAVPPSVKKPIAIIVPHAGYVFSGQIAADAYNQARNHKYDLVVLLGTNHTTPGFDGVSIYPHGGYKTPMGIAKINEEISKELMERDERFTFHPDVHVREHSVEVQVPFIQYLFPNAQIVAAVIGEPDLGLCTKFGKVLANVIKDKNVLIVASCDLSHYPNLDDAIKVDKKTLSSITELNPSAIYKTIYAQMQQEIPNLATCACGAAPIMAAVTAAKELGANCGTIISYANSGQTAFGSQDRVVGYGAVAITKNENCDTELERAQSIDESPDEFLNETDKKTLLAFARKSLKQYFESETTPLARNFEPILLIKGNAFVTLKKHGELRGCIGSLSGDLPLGQVVGTMALQAALADRRFMPVQQSELANIEVEISVLTPIKKIKNTKEIKVGRDGLVIEKDEHRGLLLPQVATEQNWDRYQFLEAICRKAGLPEGSWKEGAELYTFQAVVFKESDMK